MEQEFIVITADADGKIDGAAFYRAPADDGYKAARSRAVLSGSEKFWAFRIVKEAGKSKDAGLSFEPLEKNAEKSADKRAEKKAK